MVGSSSEVEEQAAKQYRDSSLGKGFGEKLDDNRFKFYLCYQAGKELLCRCKYLDLFLMSLKADACDRIVAITPVTEIGGHTETEVRFLRACVDSDYSARLGPSECKWRSEKGICRIEFLASYPAEVTFLCDHNDTSLTSTPKKVGSKLAMKTRSGVDSPVVF